MKDKDSVYLFESYQNHLLEGRKKQFEDRVRKTLVDPETGEERKESYYEMMMRIKGIKGHSFWYASTGEPMSSRAGKRARRAARTAPKLPRAEHLIAS